ncbi:hypothetical protein BDR26DRAFT_898404 [Obelidium mucronatum]|nr:hypothetical protein BDR26DRAFT_898404 [Obelidium mucronatum]
MDLWLFFPKYLLHNEIWVAMFMCLFVIELALLGAWTTLSKAAVIKTDLSGNVSIYQCQFTETVVGKIMWSYNCILIVGLVTVTYMSRKISSEHSEFSLLLIISVCITVSALLIGNLDKSELDYEIKSAALVYINTTAPLIMQAIPRIFVLLQTEVIPGYESKTEHFDNEGQPRLIKQKIVDRCTAVKKSISYEFEPNGERTGLEKQIFFGGTTAVAPFNSRKAGQIFQSLPSFLFWAKEG